MFGIRFLGVLAFGLMLGLPSIAAGQAVTRITPAAPDAGFELVVVGTLPGLQPEAFGRAVAEALPERLVDAAHNFTNHPGYEPGLPYRIVLMFHGDEEDEVDPEALCTRPAAADAEPPAAPEDLMAATRVAAAFCEGQQALSTATERMIGSVAPGQAGFRFLVADVAKQLFPDGFDSLPGAAVAVPAPQ